MSLGIFVRRLRQTPSGGLEPPLDFDFLGGIFSIFIDIFEIYDIFEEKKCWKNFLAPYTPYTVMNHYPLTNQNSLL